MHQSSCYVLRELHCNLFIQSSYIVKRRSVGIILSIICQVRYYKAYMDDVRLRCHADEVIEVTAGSMKEAVEVMTDGIHPRSVHIAEDETLGLYVAGLITRANSRCIPSLSSK